MAEVIILIPEHDRFGEVLVALERMDFRLRTADEDLGIVTGTVHESALPGIRSLPGVSSVEAQGVVP